MKDQVWNLCQLRSLKQYTQLLCLITIILNSFLKLCISSSILCTACPVGTQAQKPLMFVREESVIQSRKVSKLEGVLMYFLMCPIQSFIGENIEA